jgi:hypothetical protein
LRPDARPRWRVRPDTPSSRPPRRHAYTGSGCRTCPTRYTSRPRSPPSRADRMTRTRRPEFCAHRRQLPDEDLTAKHGLVLTTPARTWRDLAGVLDLPSLVAAGDSVLRAGTSVEELTAVINRTTRCRHVRAARIALALLDGRSRSRPESHLRVAVSAPRPAAVRGQRRDQPLDGWMAGRAGPVAPAGQARVGIPGCRSCGDQADAARHHAQCRSAPGGVAVLPVRSRRSLRPAVGDQGRGARTAHPTCTSLGQAAPPASGHLCVEWTSIADHWTHK